MRLMSDLLLDADTLAELGAIATSAMPNSGVIVRPRLLDDGAGGTYPDPAGPERIDTACSFTAVAALPGPLRDQLQEYGRYLITVPLATAVLATDQVEVLGGTYAVTWAPPPDGFAVERMAVLVEAP
jgi:hypothetical protein